MDIEGADEALSLWLRTNRHFGRMTPSRKDLSAVPTDQGDRADTEPKKGAKRDPAAFVGGGGTKGSSLEGSGLYGLLVESVQDYAIFILDPEGRVATWITFR